MKHVAKTPGWIVTKISDGPKRESEIEVLELHTFSSSRGFAVHVELRELNITLFNRFEEKSDDGRDVAIRDAAIEGLLDVLKGYWTKTEAEIRKRIEWKPKLATRRPRGPVR
jgi:hypothetical protein